MSTNNRAMTILVGEDDPDDRKILKKAFGVRNRAVHLVFVEDGEEVLDYLHRRGIYHHPDSSPRPDLILLDLYLPKQDGKTVLRNLRQSPDLKTIPVIVLTGSRLDRDLVETYDLGANS
jgi:CheY-like chemotaxis protein